MTPVLTIGVVADTHIPDRMRAIPERVYGIFDGVTAILHAGDLSAPRVLDDLGRIAPVHAVAGNSDFLRLRLPLNRVLEFDGVRIGLTHGHGGWGRYLVEKVIYHAAGYRVRRYLRLARSRFAEVDVVVFGHTHRPMNCWDEGVLMFNPGSLGPDYVPPNGPAVGLLRIEAGTVLGEIVGLRA